MRRKRLCTSASRVTASLLLSVLAVSSASASDAPILPPPPSIPDPAHNSPVREFFLRHIFHHGAYKYPELHRRLDIPEQASVWMTDEEGTSERVPVPRLRAKAEVMSIQRLVDRSKDTIDGILDWGRMTGRAVQLAAEDWTIDELPGPNVSDKETVLSFAHMASNAYILEPHTGEWQDVGGGYNYTEDFGWESDGLRGHIFADRTNSTVVIGVKGTSPAVFDGSETTANDKINDNLFFSCCCGQGGQYLWRQVCDCQTAAYTCNSTCLVKALRAKNRYYSAARDLYHNVTAMYPNAEVWMAGHSLGGAVSSFIALTYGHPALTFEAVPEAMPAARLGLPTPPGHQVGALQTRKMTGGFHFGHTADPVYMGQCNTVGSSCTLGGYAMQSVCHTGLKCVYDTVSDLGWRVGIGTHKIVNVIRDVIEKYDTPATCEPYRDCTDCYPWEFFESNGTEPSSSTSMITSTKTTSKSKSLSTSWTRTETCKTPGWWGCLDEPETTTVSTTSSSSSSPTTSCKTPGWFGCKDETTAISTTSKPGRRPAPAPTPSITTTTKAKHSPSSTTSCETPGWFGGCLDPTSSPSRPHRSHSHTPNPTSSSCETPGWFGGCYDPTASPTPTNAPTSSRSRQPSETTTSCTSKAFFGLICLDPDNASPTKAVDAGEDLVEVMEM